jgi:dipeptidyl aminopeptidase/acylaminoacyl peptidase
VEAELRAACMPVWIFHGADDIVPVTESRRMTEAMKQIGAEVRYTEYPGVGHPLLEQSPRGTKVISMAFL